jgi:hypothetical protein
VASGTIDELFRDLHVEIPAGHERIDELFRQARAELFK